MAKTDNHFVFAKDHLKPEVKTAQFTGPYNDQHNALQSLSAGSLPRDPLASVRLVAQTSRARAARSRDCPGTETGENAGSREREHVLDVNLMTGVTSSLPAGMTWHSKLTSGRGECACDRQGVLKLTVESGMAAQINMTFSHSSGFTFNVGDSATNDGYGGDRNTQQNDAEVHSLNNNINFYGRDKPGGGSYGLLHSEGSFVGTQPFTTVTLHVADELATAHNGLTYLYINSPKLFALNGQSDADGVNYDVYLGMNRVVGSTARTGTGLCRVSVRFYQL